MSTLSPEAVVYLAGPMTNMPRFNFDAFAEARQALRGLGFEVMCPAEADAAAGFDPDGEAGPFWEYMARDLPMVCRATALVLLPGWRQSKGCAIETGVATALGIPLYEYPDLSPVEDETILEEAQRIVHGPRRESYGHPLDNFERAAVLMGAWLQARGLLAPGATLTAEDTAALMIQGKLARECHTPKRDNLTDICGYTAAWHLTIEERERRGT